MNKALFVLPAVVLWAFCLPAKELLEIKGDYLLYSYDFNYVYGQGNIQIKCKEWTIQAETVEIDMAGRAALAGRNCRVEAGKQKYKADTLEIDLSGSASFPGPCRARKTPRPARMPLSKKSPPKIMKRSKNRWFIF
jgi:hypothetical protein